MYEIIQITQDKYHFFIYRNDDCVKVQRKHIFDATHSPLTSNEELINALCRKILRPIINGHAEWCTATGEYQTSDGIFCASCNRFLRKQ